jgi:hypothetical protein
LVGWFVDWFFLNKHQHCGFLQNRFKFAKTLQTEAEKEQAAVQVLLETLPPSDASMNECATLLRKLDETLDSSIAEVAKIREIFGAGFDNTGVLLALLDGHTLLEKGLARQRNGEAAKAADQLMREQEHLIHECRMALEASDHDLSMQLARLEVADDVWGEAECVWRQQCASQLERPAEVEMADSEFAHRRRHAIAARVALTHQKL